MRKILLGGAALATLITGAAIAQQTTFVIQGTQVPVYTVAAVDGLLAALDSRISALEGGSGAHTHATADVTGLDATLSAHDGRLDAVEADLVTANAALAARVLISPAAGNDISAVFMGTQAECNAISPKSANTFYICL